MLRCERGDIVFISSVATDHNAANGAPYNMAKAAMEALAYGLAKEEKRGRLDKGGQRSRQLRAVAGVDQIAQGMGGLMSVTGPPGGGFWRVGIPIADLAAADGVCRSGGGDGDRGTRRRADRRC